MSFTVTKNENYHLIKLTQAALTPENTDKLKTECAKLVKVSPFIIFNCKEIKTLDNTQKNLFVSIQALAAKANGSIILSQVHDDDITEMLEKAGLNCVPTDAEAVDFIFMESVENEFMDDDDDDDDDY